MIDLQAQNPHQAIQELANCQLPSDFGLLNEAYLDRFSHLLSLKSTLDQIFLHDHRQLQFRKQQGKSVPNFLNEVLLVSLQNLKAHLKVRKDKQLVYVVFRKRKGYTGVIMDSRLKERLYAVPLEYLHICFMIKAFCILNKGQLQIQEPFVITRMLTTCKSALFGPREICLDQLLTLQKLKAQLLVHSANVSERLGIFSHRTYVLQEVYKEQKAVKLRSALPQAWSGEGCIQDRSISKQFNFSSQFFVKIDDFTSLFQSGLIVSDFGSYYLFNQSVTFKNRFFFSLSSDSTALLTVSHSALPCRFSVRIYRQVQQQLKLLKCKSEEEGRMLSLVVEQGGKFLVIGKGQWQNNFTNDLHCEIAGKSAVQIKIKRLPKDKKFQLYARIFKDNLEACPLVTSYGLCPKADVLFYNAYEVIGYMIVRIKAVFPEKEALSITLKADLLLKQGLKSKFPMKGKQQITQIVQEGAISFLKPLAKQFLFPPLSLQFHFCQVQISQ